MPWDDYDPINDRWLVDYWFQPGILSLGWHAIAWAEAHFKQPNGPRVKKPFRFTPGQKRFLLWFYSLDEAGRWQFHRGIRRLSKGSGKSPFAGILCLIEFCAPVRLKKILDPEHPDPARRLSSEQVNMPWVQIVATSEKQAHNTMRMVRAFAPPKSMFVQELGLDPGKTIYYDATGNKLEIITSSPVGAEGAEPTFMVQDETQKWIPGNSGPELNSVIADNLAKSSEVSGSPRALETCNAWVPGQESVAQKHWDAWVAQEEGKVRSETRILYDARIAPPETDLYDAASLKGALEFVYRDCSWRKPHREVGEDLVPIAEELPEVRPLMNRIYDVSSRPDDSKRKYLNRPTAAMDAWVTPEAWSMMVAKREVGPDEAIGMFFDGSKSRDATALAACTIGDGYVFELGVWEKPQGPEGDDWQVPVEDVDARVDWAFANHDVVAFYGDVKEWESFVGVSWPERHKDRLFLWAMRTGKNAGPIAWDMRNRVSDFTYAAEACQEEIMGHMFSHDGSPAIARHIANARNYPNRYGTSIRKESPDSPLKIDAAVCVIGARMVRKHVLASPEWAKRKRKTGKAVFF